MKKTKLKIGVEVNKQFEKAVKTLIKNEIKKQVKIAMNELSDTTHQKLLQQIIQTPANTEHEKKQQEEIVEKAIQTVIFENVNKALNPSAYPMKQQPIITKDLYDLAKQYTKHHIKAVLPHDRIIELERIEDLSKHTIVIKRFAPPCTSKSKLTGRMFGNYIDNIKKEYNTKDKKEDVLYTKIIMQNNSEICICIYNIMNITVSDDTIYLHCEPTEI